jgi:hypothetical protein
LSTTQLPAASAEPSFHAGYPVTGGCEAPGDRKAAAAAAADIEDIPAIGKMSLQVSQPRAVFLR